MSSNIETDVSKMLYSKETNKPLTALVVFLSQLVSELFYSGGEKVKCVDLSLMVDWLGVNLMCPNCYILEERKIQMCCQDST